MPLLVAQAPAHSINVTPTEVTPGDQFTVSGTSDCASSPYTVTLSYVHAQDGPTTATASGTTDASGEYVQQVTLPEHTTKAEPTSVEATVTSCDGGGAAESNSVNLSVDPHEGTLTVSPTEGPTGTEVTLTGGNCWGDEVTAGFGDGEEFDYSKNVTDLTLAEDRRFTGSFTIPADAAPGDYVFFADCPGSEFAFAEFTVTARTGDDGTTTPPPTAPPAEPVPGTPTFTG
jgi:hypothetical protein